MKGLLNKKIQRLLDLIVFLEIQGQTGDSQDIQEKLNYSPLALVADIKEANAVFVDILEIQKQESIEINYKNGNTYLNAFALALQKEPLCNMLEKLFFEPHLSVAQMANRLFVSPSTIYRWVDHFNQTIKASFDIYLNTNPLDMCGKEWEVRTFYTNFFREKYPIYEWPFPNIEREAIAGFLNQALPLKYAKNFLNYYDCFHIQVAVTAYRFSQGFRINEEILSKNRLIIPFVNQVMEMHLTIPWLTPADDAENSSRFVEELLAPFANNHDAETFSRLMELAEENPLTNTTVIYINKVIADLRDLFDVPLSNESELVLAIYNALLGSFGRMLIRSVFYSPYTIYQGIIHHRFPATSEQILAAIRQENEYFSVPYDSEIVSYLFYVIWTTWSDLATHLTPLPHKIKTLIVSRFSIFHAISLRDQIEIYFGNKIEADVAGEIPIPGPSGRISNYELIISNFKIKGLKTPAIFSEGILSYKDYRRLSEAIYQILSGRKPG